MDEDSERPFSVQTIVKASNCLVELDVSLLDLDANTHLRRNIRLSIAIKVHLRANNEDVKSFLVHL